jgi:hypothetical protein
MGAPKNILHPAGTKTDMLRWSNEHLAVPHHPPNPPSAEPQASGLGFFLFLNKGLIAAVD